VLWFLARVIVREPVMAMLELRLVRLALAWLEQLWVLL
jgi:hypothetical protein